MLAGDLFGELGYKLSSCRLDALDLVEEGGAEKFATGGGLCAAGDAGTDGL